MCLLGAHAASQLVRLEVEKRELVNRNNTGRKWWQKCRLEINSGYHCLKSRKVWTNHSERTAWWRNYAVGLHGLELRQQFDSSIKKKYDITLCFQSQHYWRRHYWQYPFQQSGHRTRINALWSVQPEFEIHLWARRLIFVNMAIMKNASKEFWFFCLQIARRMWSGSIFCCAPAASKLGAAWLRGITRKWDDHFFCRHVFWED